MNLLMPDYYTTFHGQTSKLYGYETWLMMKCEVIHLKMFDIINNTGIVDTTMIKHTELGIFKIKRLKSCKLN